MNAQEVRERMDAGAVPLDLRTPRPFAEAHLPGAVNLQFNRADLADRAAMVLPRDPSYVVHAEPDAIARIAAELLREAGFTVEGWLEGGLRAWRDAGYETASVPVLTVDELRDRGAADVLDVREGFEYRHAHIAGAVNVPWTETWARAAELDRGRSWAVVCGDEVRSAAAASILRRQGLDTRLVLGGMIDWLEAGHPTEKGPGAADAGRGRTSDPAS